MNLFRILFKDKFFAYYSIGGFCLSFMSEVGLLLSNSLIINKLGSEQYADLYFWAILGSMLFYIVFSAFRESAVRVFYLLVLLFLTGSSFLFFGNAGQTGLVEIFVINFLLVDFIGPNVFSGVLVGNSSPTVFREVFQRVLSIQLFSRILASASMVALSRLNVIDWAMYLFWFALAGHVFCLGKVTWAAQASDAGKVEIRPSFRHLKSAILFLFRNHFIRTVLQISVFATVVRILVDYLYLQAVGNYFSVPNDVSAFLSTISLITIVTVYAFQKLVGRNLMIRKNLGLLYSFQPFGLILIATSLILFPSLVVSVLMMVFAQCAGRGIQMPLFRQSMVALPKSLRTSVMFIVSLFLSASGLVSSGLISVTKMTLPADAFVICVIAISIVLLFMAARLDSFYVRNLWSVYREMREGQWLERRLGFSQSPFHLMTQMSIVALEESVDANPFEEDQKTHARSNNHAQQHNPLKRISHLLRTDPRHHEMKGLLTLCLSADRIATSSKRILIRRVYEVCYDKEVLYVASQYHKELLCSDDDREVFEGIRLAETLGIRRLKKMLPSLETRGALISQAAELAFTTETFMESLGPLKLSGVTLRKLRSVARDFIEVGEEARLFTKLEWLLANESEKRVRAIIDILYHPHFTMVREQLLLGMNVREKAFNILPLLRQMSNMDYLEAQEIRWALRRIGYGEQRELIFSQINHSLSALLENNFNIWSAEKFMDKRLCNLFLHALFLEEWVDSMYRSISYFNHTIKDLIKLEGSQKEMLASIHLEYLKKNASFPVWKVLLAKESKQKDWLKAKRELTRLLVEAS